MGKHLKYTKEMLEPLITENYSWAAVLTKLNKKLTGGNYQTIKSWARYYELDFSHFTGKLWSKGQTKETNQALAKQASKTEAQLNEVLIVKAKPMPSARLKARLFRLGLLRNECYICGLTLWRGKSITLHLDHINGVHNDNRLENLQVLCPNCHQQTDTWGNKNTGR